MKPSDLLNTQQTITESFIDRCERFIDNCSTKVNVLDIGCGQGTFISKHLKEKYGQRVSITGIDPCDFRTENKYVDRFIVASLEDVKEEIAPSHLLYAHFVCEHMNDLDLVFRKVSHMVVKDGILIFTVMNPTSFEFLISASTPFSFHKWFKKIIERCPEREVYPTTYPYRSVIDLIKPLEKNGFSVVDKEFFCGTANYLRNNVVLCGLGRIYEKMIIKGSAYKLATHLLIEAQATTIP